MVENSIGAVWRDSWMKSCNAQRALVASVGVLLTSVILAGCAGPDSVGRLGAFSDATGSRHDQEAANNAKPAIAETARAHAQAPGDPKIAIQYARRLKAAGRQREALAVLEAMPEGAQAYQPLLVEHGLLALELGQTAKGQQLLLRASPERTKDWQVLSGLGIAASNLGQQSDAQKYFSRALELSPNNPTLLNNLALSYILDRKLTTAEELLQRATKSTAPPARVTRNLELARALKTDPGFAEVAQWTTTTTRNRTAGETPAPQLKLSAARVAAD